MNLSNEINWFIQKYEYSNFDEIKFGEVLNSLTIAYNLLEASEEECIESLKDMKAHWLKRDYIRETIAASTLLSIMKREAKTLSDIADIIKEEFEIFDIKTEVHEVYNHIFEIKYYRNSDFCEKRHYIEVTVLTEPDFSTIEKILDVRKGLL